MNPVDRFLWRECAANLRWRFNPMGMRHRRRIAGWRDAHQGRKAVILCNGPSLLDTDFAALDGVFTFGLNKVHLLIERTGFTPSAVVAVNRFVIQQCAAVYRRIDLPLFIDSVHRHLVPDRPQVHYLRTTRVPLFSQEAHRYIYQGFTVTFVALQLAYFMGFEAVALVGCDHSFACKGRPNEVAVSGASDANHFDQRYFAGGVKWQLPDLIGSEMAYQMADQAWAAAGRRIVNCTVGGRLEIFPRQDLAAFIGDD